VSEGASPRPWGQEHSIDLGAVEGPVSARASDPSPPNRYPYVHNIALAYAAIAIALAAAVITAVKWSPLHRPVAESAVLAFLEAVRDGDVEGALAHTDQGDITDTAVTGTAGPSGSSDLSEPSDATGDAEEPDGPEWDATRGEYLAPEALDARWEIVAVAQVEYQELEGGNEATAEVYAEIEAYDGTRIGHRYRVSVEHGRAEITGAVPEVEAWGAFDYLDMNGVRLEMDPDVGFANIYLLPGLYEFYPELPPTVALEGTGTMLVLGDTFLTLGEDVPDEWMPAPFPEVTDEGEDAVNAALRAHYDACTVDLAGEGCPLGFPEDSDRELVPAPGATWEVTVYPLVSAEQLWYEFGLGYSLQTAIPGEARVLAQITEDGHERTALVSCPIWVDGLYAQLDVEGGATVHDGEHFAADSCRSVIEIE
jgi:hypothetical protein